MLPTLVAFDVFQRANAINNAPPAALPRSAAEEIAYWRETIPTIGSVADLTGDPRLMDVLARAFGFEADAPSPARLQAAMEAGLKDPLSPANLSPDDRLLRLVRLAGTPTFGMSGLRGTRFVETVAAQYATAILRDDTSTAPSAASSDPDASYFLQTIGRIADADDLLGDDRLTRYALRAFGLAGRDLPPVILRQALVDGIADTTDLANQLDDPRLREMVQTFGFGEVGALKIVDPSFGPSIVRRVEALEALQARAEAPPSDDDPETAYFRRAIGTIQSAADLVKDRRLLSYVMTAFDLAGDLDKTGLVAKVLDEGVSARNTIGNRLPDPRYRELARTLAFAEFGTASIRDPAVLADIETRYARVRAEQDAGADNPAVELAAYFDRKADGLTSWIFVTADARLRNVALTTLGMPPAAGALDTNRLVAALERRFAIEDLQDPAKREAFLRRFLILSDSAVGPRAAVPGAGALTILNTGNTAGPGLYGLVSQL